MLLHVYGRKKTPLAKNHVVGELREVAKGIREREKLLFGHKRRLPTT